MLICGNVAEIQYIIYHIFVGQSVLLQDEAKYNGNAGGDFAINMDMDKSRYQQQLQLIDEQVTSQKYI